MHAGLWSEGPDTPTPVDAIVRLVRAYARNVRSDARWSRATLPEFSRDIHSFQSATNFRQRGCFIRSRFLCRSRPSPSRSSDVQRSPASSDAVLRALSISSFLSPDSSRGHTSGDTARPSREGGGDTGKSGVWEGGGLVTTVGGSRCDIVVRWKEGCEDIGMHVDAYWERVLRIAVELWARDHFCGRGCCRRRLLIDVMKIAGEDSRWPRVEACGGRCSNAFNVYV